MDGGGRGGWRRRRRRSKGGARFVIDYTKSRAKREARQRITGGTEQTETLFGVYLSLICFVSQKANILSVFRLVSSLIPFAIYSSA